MIEVIALSLFMGAASDGIRRLPPSSFKQLPANVAEELHRRGCTIPQSPWYKRPHNVVSGEFARPGQTDWAVLCSTRGVSSILVFWHGSVDNAARLAPSNDDVQIIRDMQTGKPLYARAIGVVGKEFIHRHSAALDTWAPTKIDHQGIEDIIHETASEVHYYYRGKWLKLAGAD